MRYSHFVQKFNFHQTMKSHQYIIPDGFSIYHSKDKNRKRLYVKCNHVIIKNGKKYNCNFQKRLDSLPKNTDLTNYLDHKCSHSDLKGYFQTTTIQKDEPPGKLLISLLAQFAGKYNLSMEAAVSNALYKVMEYSFLMGQQNPSASPEEIFPTLNRKKFTKELILAGKEQFQEIITKYKKINFAALSIDAGKIGSKNYFDVLLCNALDSIRPIIYKAYQNFKGDTEEYFFKIKSVIEEVESIGIHVSGVVCDNLRVQTAAIEKIINEFPSLFHFCCGPHSVHNGLKDAFTHDELSIHIRTIESFSIIMNRKDILSKIKISTPKRCLTRWTNLFDIAFFVIEHSDTFISFFEDPNSYELSTLKNTENLQVIHQMLQVTAPLISLLLFYPKKLSLKLEADRTSCGFLFGYENSLYIQLQAVGETYPDIKPYTDLIVNCIKARLSQSSNGLLSKLAFLLTKEGRNIFIETEVKPHLQQTLNNIITEEEKQNYENETKIKKNKAYSSTFPFFEENDEIIFNEMYGLYSDPPKLEELTKNINIFEEAELHEEEEEHGEKEEVESENDIECEEDEEFFSNFNSDEEDDESLTYDPLEELLESQAEEEMTSVYQTEHVLPLYESAFGIEEMMNFLQEKAISLNLSEERVVASFFRWIEEPSTLSKPVEALLNQKNNFEFWKDMLLIDDMKDLAVLALRLLSIPASEAACERTFWKQRKILTDQRARTGTQLAFSRIVLMSL